LKGGGDEMHAPFAALFIQVAVVTRIAVAVQVA